MNEREMLARFDTIWARVQPEQTAPRQEAEPHDDRETLRTMIDQTAAAVNVLCVTASKTPCRAAQLKALACARTVMLRQLQGAYYLLTGGRHTPGASCTVRHESAACLRCLWLAGRRMSAQARQCAEATKEPLLRELFSEYADLLDAQAAALQDIVCALIV